MNLDHDSDRLRSITRTLRPEPDEAAVSRLRTNVARALATQPGLRGTSMIHDGPLSALTGTIELLANLFRPVTLTLAALLTIFALALIQQQQSATSTDLLASVTTVSSGAEELYR